VAGLENSTVGGITATMGDSDDDDENEPQAIYIVSNPAYNETQLPSRPII
jgi:hypothetical protein